MKFVTITENTYIYDSYFRTMTFNLSLPIVNIHAFTLNVNELKSEITNLIFLRLVFDLYAHVL